MLRATLSGKNVGILALRYRQNETTTITAASMHYVRSDGWWVQDHKAGPHPGDDEARRKAAAQRYGLLPIDYKPYDAKDPPIHALGWGDYPDLGVVTFAQKDPYENYSYYWPRRNWGEPVPLTYDSTTGYALEQFTGIERPQLKSWRVVAFIIPFFGAVLAFIYFNMASEYTNDTFAQPYMPRQYPYDYKRAYPFHDHHKYPITNYTFELASAPDHHHHDDHHDEHHDDHHH